MKKEMKKGCCFRPPMPMFGGRHHPMFGPHHPMFGPKHFPFPGMNPFMKKECCKPEPPKEMFGRHHHCGEKPECCREKKERCCMPKFPFGPWGMCHKMEGPKEEPKPECKREHHHGRHWGRHHGMFPGNPFAAPGEHC